MNNNITIVVIVAIFFITATANNMIKSHQNTVAQVTAAAVTCYQAAAINPDILSKCPTLVMDEK